jgi:hypothetical protein
MLLALPATAVTNALFVQEMTESLHQIGVLTVWRCDTRWFCHYHRRVDQ